jgi:hypothetical protein
MILEQQDVEHNLKIIDQHSSKAMSGISKASIIRLLVLIMMSVAALFIFIMTGCVFYDHPHQNHLFESLTSKDLQSASTDLSISVGPMVISTSSVNIPSTERRALQDLYESTDGVHWNYGSSSAGTHWSFDDPDVNPCAEGWYGVQCSNNRITGLTLVGSNLIGTIPESLSQQTMLMHLDLGGNLLIGRVPITLCQIKSLVLVDLEENSIACYPHCLEHAVVEVKVHPSTPVCNNILSPSSLSGPSEDVSSSSLVMTSSYSNNIPPSLQPSSQQSHQNLLQFI